MLADVQKPSVVRYMVGAAAFVVIIAGMKAASAILIPFLLSAFLAVISAPSLFWMKRKGLPTWLALLAVVLIISVGVTAVSTVVGTSVASFSQNIPGYQAGLQEKTQDLVILLERVGVEVPENALQQYFNPGLAMRMVQNLFTAFGGVLSNVFLILLTVIFMLLESSGFPTKLRALSTDPNSSEKQFDVIAENMKRYVGIKTTTSFATGLLIAIWLTIIGVDYPLLWGLLAFLLNFVPSIGSIIAAVPPVLLALVVVGPGTAGLAALGFAVVNVCIGNMIEPKFMGEGLGLSTLVVFLSLLFWGWVLGPVGMLLAVPLTMAAKIVLENNESTRAVGILLGPSIKPSEPVEKVAEKVAEKDDS